jgi:hypothetical protein
VWLWLCIKCAWCAWCVWFVWFVWFVVMREGGGQQNSIFVLLWGTTPTYWMYFVLTCSQKTRHVIWSRWCQSCVDSLSH